MHPLWLFILFAAPPERELDWSDKGVEGSFRFLNRVYRLIYNAVEEGMTAAEEIEPKNDDDKKLMFILNKTIKKVTEDIGERFSFNTAISSIMEFVNELYRYKRDAEMNEGLFVSALEKLILMLSPFTPHMCEEMWEAFSKTERVYNEAWPESDESALVQDIVEAVLQINGKVKEKIKVAANITKNEFEKFVLENERVKEFIEGKDIVKVISVPGKLVNIVVK